MKKITKAQIKEAPNYILIIDYKTQYRDFSKAPFEYRVLTAKSVFDAMNEAENVLDEHVYLMKLAEKTANVDPEMGIIYRAVLANRHNGWHVNDLYHSEGGHSVTYNPAWSFDPVSFYDFN